VLKQVSYWLLSRNERRLGVTLDYARKIAATSLGLMIRYGKIFDFLDPRRHTTAEAYATARLRGALAADCGTCVKAEVNQARHAGLPDRLIADILLGDVSDLPQALQPVRLLADAVCGQRLDDVEARARIVELFGDKGLIELSFAMNGAAILPGIKRAMGYATACDATVFQELKLQRGPHG
jgi:hypothetical protein